MTILLGLFQLMMGTVHVLEACRRSSQVGALINVTSDKCYENLNQKHAYVEDDRLQDTIRIVPVKHALRS